MFRIGSDYRRFSKVRRIGKQIKTKVNKRHKITMEFRETKVTYFIDDVEHAWCIFKKGTLPEAGYIGFGVNNLEELEAEQLVELHKLDHDGKLVGYVTVEQMKPKNEHEDSLEESVFESNDNIEMAPSPILWKKRSSQKNK